MEGFIMKNTNRNTKKWRVVDNYHEKILKEDFLTEEEAENFVEELIKVHKKRNESYDYNVDCITPRMNYSEYIENIKE